MAEQRKYSRVPFLTSCVLVTSGAKYNLPLIDISLRGALIKTPRNWDRKPKTGMLELRLEHSDVVIRMTVKTAHQRKGYTGLRCLTIDVDSITHLRRLMELNLGDPGLVERELTSLAAP